MSDLRRLMPSKAAKFFLHLNRWFTQRKIASKGFTSQQSVFTKIYQSRFWGDNETVSGSGSTLHYTQQVRQELPLLVEQYQIDSIFDAPCGDYHWFKEIHWLSPIHYQGADIVAELIEQNTQRYQGSGVAFIHFNIVEQIPQVIGKNTLWFCRDCLFHLPLSSIHAVLMNFVKSEMPYFLTSVHYKVTHNIDIQAGEFRVLDLQKEPFNLPQPIAQFDDYPEGTTPRFMGLWTRQQIALALGMTIDDEQGNQH